jgi:AAA15 family ATPase/GTPase
MLTKFTIENFLSIKDPLEIDFTASSIKEHEDDNLIHYNNTKFLKSAAIYGANSSGKSNILKALIFVKKFILNSSKDQIGDAIEVEPFRLNTQTENKPSKFEIQFLLNGIKYRYGFQVDAKEIHAEWLYYTKINKEYNYFNRIHQIITVDEKYSEGKDIENKTRQNALFLSVVSQFNGKIATQIIKWFYDIKYILDTNKHFQQKYSKKLFENPLYKGIIKRYLNRGDLGFSDIESKKMGITDSNSPDLKDFSPEFRELILNDFNSENALMTAHPQYDENENATNNIVFFNMQSNESLGTQKYFEMSGFIIEALIHGNVLIIDEFDARLHPLLCTSIIKLFNSKINNFRNAQLIFVSHNTNFLSKKIFRRDQILVAKKNKFGSTSLTSLAQEKVRGDEAYERNYLQGAYEGIPNIDENFNLWGSQVI